MLLSPKGGGRFQLNSRLQNFKFFSERVLATAIFLLFLAGRGEAAERQRFKSSHVPAAVAGLAPAGILPAEQRLKLALSLPLRNQDALEEFLRQAYDPASTNYHRWLTPQEFTEQFGPTEQDYRALADFATANGLTVTFEHPNRVVLDVEGAVQDIESAFQITLRTYHHPTEGRDFYAPDTEPTVDLPIPVLDVSGLDNFSLPTPHHKIKPLPPGQAAIPNAGSGPGGAYRGSDFRAAYVPGNSLNGTGQSVGLLQFDGYHPSDITTYESQAGLPNVTLVNVPIDGGVSSPGSGNSEVCLDIEMVVSMAPGVSAIYVYEAPNPSPWVDLLSRMANDNLSKQLGCSWGGGGVDAASETIFKQMSAQGQSFFNATGDSDAFTTTIPFPSDSTNITQVGGTTLSTTGPGGSYVSETVWNWGLQQGSYVGSSGGVSTYYGIPGYQLGISMAANQGSTTKRNVPDVALTGDNVYVVYNNGTAATFGGTSCAAPLWAGLMALVNQQAAANSLPPIGFLNPAVYALGKGANYASTFHDITTGNNFSSSSPSKFSAVTGFDLCTGWGTPLGNGLINALAGPPAPLIISNNFTLSVESCTNNAIDPGEAVTILFGLKNTGAANTTNLVATLQASGGVTSPSGAQTYGSLVAGGASVSKPFSFVANGTCGGALVATLQLQDGSANLGSLAFVIGLGQLIPGTTLTQNFDSVTAPALPAGWTAALASGAQTDWISSTTAVDSAPNAAFALDSSSLGANAMVSPVIPVATSSAQLTFRHNYNLEMHTKGRSTTYYDGGVLEIKIGTGAFTDMLAAGGSFVAGGYNCTLSSSSGNSLGGRSAWGGTSSGWTSTTVNLPAAAAGQNVQLRWVCATDSGNTYTAVGWYVDTISLQDAYYACCTPNGSVAPAITTQPTGQVAVAGSTVSFSVAATGTATLAYQWLFGATNLPGATNLTLTLSNVQPAQAGNYRAIVTNSAGSATSSVAVLTVLVPPAFTIQPSNKTAVAGSNVSLDALASGSAPLSYEWYFNGTNPVGNGGANLTLSNVQPAQAGPYRVIATNSAGSATSVVATLTVLVPPAFTLQPSNKTAIAGSNVSFDSLASGSAPLAYQWYFNGTNPVGSGSASLNLSNVQPAQAGLYQVIVTNVAGSATSSAAILAFFAQPILSAPALNSNGAFTFLLNGDAGQNYLIETTTNWQDWDQSGSLTDITGQALFTDTNATSGVLRAYRARLIP